MSIIKTDNAPTPGNYSQAVKVNMGWGWLIYTSGQTGNFPAKINKDEPVVEGIYEQTTQTLLNLEAVLKEAGADFSDIIKTTVYLEDLEKDKPGFEAAYKRFFEERGIKDLPARCTVGVKSVPLATEPTIVEIEVVAYLGPNQD